MSTVMLVGRLLLSLALVLAVMWFIAMRVRKPLARRNTQIIDVLGRQQLSRASSVTLVRVNDRALILGVTETQVSVLGETDLDAVQEQIAAHRAARDESSSARRIRGTATRNRTVAGRSADPSTTGVAVTGPLAGSLLSPVTWSRFANALTAGLRVLVERLRDATARGPKPDTTVSSGAGTE